MAWLRIQIDDILYRKFKSYCCMEGISLSDNIREYVINTMMLAKKEAMDEADRRAKLRRDKVKAAKKAAKEAAKLGAKKPAVTNPQPTQRVVPQLTEQELIGELSGTPATSILDEIDQELEERRQFIESLQGLSEEELWASLPTDLEVS